MKLLSICLAFGSLILLTSCADKKKSDHQPIRMSEEKQETTTQAQKTSSVPIMLDNKGIGPVKSVTFSDEIDQELAKRGAELFKLKCTACHNATQRTIGPPMAGIYKKRSPEWVMNIILNPEEMLKKDPVAMALLKEYNNTVMLDQNIPEDEARAMAEWFRTLK